MTTESFRTASDRQRHVTRLMMEVAGCPDCPYLVIVRGRNCNEFGCPIQHNCKKMAAVQKAAELLAAHPKQEKTP